MKKWKLSPVADDITVYVKSLRSTMKKSPKTSKWAQQAHRIQDRHTKFYTRWAHENKIESIMAFIITQNQIAT